MIILLIAPLGLIILMTSLLVITIVVTTVVVVVVVVVVGCGGVGVGCCSSLSNCLTISEALSRSGLLTSLCFQRR